MLPKVPYDNCVEFLRACDAASRKTWPKEFCEAELLLKEGKEQEFVEAVTLMMYLVRPRETNSNRLH